MTPHSSASSESDKDADTPSKQTQDKKRPHTSNRLEGEDESSTVQAFFNSISRRLDTLVTKDEVCRRKNQLQLLTQTFMDKIEKPECRVCEVVARNNHLGKEIKCLKKEKESLWDTVKWQENQVRKIQKEQNDLQQHSRWWNPWIYKVPEQMGETANDCMKKCSEIFTQKVEWRLTKAKSDQNSLAAPTSNLSWFAFSTERSGTRYLPADAVWGTKE